MTFSIIARDEKSGAFGIAVSTANLAVGAVGYSAKAGVGIIATQADPHPIMAQNGLRMLDEGFSAEDTLRILLQEDSDKIRRQIHLLDCEGRAAAWTGDCVDWAGHHVFDGFSVSGNMLVGEATILAMAATYSAVKHVGFGDRLLSALQAGQAAGGDKRGKQSAALYIVSTQPYADIDLRVDDHSEPIAELLRIYEESQKPYYVDFRRRLPKTTLPHGDDDTKANGTDSSQGSDTEDDRQREAK